MKDECRKISFSPPDISEMEISEVVSTLKSGWITTGARTKTFEKNIAEYIGTTKAVCLSSATAALEMTLRILGIGPGDEVITSPYTYTASASVIDHVGAKIIFLDTAADSFEMDYDILADAITPRTKAIIPIDIGGKMCNYSKIFDVIERRKLLFHAENQLQKIYSRPIVISDSAHGFGAEFNGAKSGTVADFTCFSFHAVKNLTTSEGGAVVWKDVDGLNSDWLYHEFMLYSLHGQSKDAFEKNQLGSWEYDILYPAYKCNMTDIQAAIGLKQLERYDGLLKRRRELIEKYDRSLLQNGLLTMSHFSENYTSSGHLYMTRIPGCSEELRNAIIFEMAEKGIACNVHFKPLPMMTAYKNMGFHIADYPNAFAQYQNEITLPLHTQLKDEDIEYIMENYLDVIKRIRV